LDKNVEFNPFLADVVSRHLRDQSGPTTQV